MKAFRKLKFCEVCDELAKPKNTLILFHTRPDGDAVGSALNFLNLGIQDSTLPEAIPANFEAERILTVDTASPSQLGALYEVYGGKIDMMIDHHAKGEPYAALAEGYYTVKAVVEMGKQQGISMPICRCVYSILYENRDPKSALGELFERSLKNEI